VQSDVSGGYRVFLDQRPSLSSIFRMGFEVGFEARRPHAE
jgi:hypothetical protein